ncbi:MAG: hypothetical protein D4S01_03985 [Dehalococcoidia bacterium]|nr:MAG: hypothetical protein D4S01_03985 [Dehalococcoidia bacterium]
MSKEKNFFSIKNGYARLKVSSKAYTLSSIYAAGYVFLERAYIILDNEKDSFLVYLYPQKDKKNLQRLALDFYNELLNYSHYFSRLKANAESIKILMQRALFSASPALAQEAEEKEISQLIKELEEEDDKATASKKKR